MKEDLIGKINNQIIENLKKTECMTFEDILIITKTPRPFLEVLIQQLNESGKLNKLVLNDLPAVYYLPQKKPEENYIIVSTLLKSKLARKIARLLSEQEKWTIKQMVKKSNKSFRKVAYHLNNLAKHKVATEEHGVFKINPPFRKWVLQELERKPEQ